MISPEFPTTAVSGAPPYPDTTVRCGMQDAGGGRNSFARAIVASYSRADPARRPELCAIEAIQHKAPTAQQGRHAPFRV